MKIYTKPNQEVYSYASETSIVFVKTIKIFSIKNYKTTVLRNKENLNIKYFNKNKYYTTYIKQ